jgi:uncharacterized protein (DUF305 family)
MKTSISIAAMAALFLAGAPAMAQQSHSGHDGHAAHGKSAPAPASAKEAYEAANAKMHKDMAIDYAGDADRDFARGMIPHHQGAIDMAKVVLQYGKDPEIRKLAEEIVAAQEKEIAWMKEWLAKKQ